MRAVQDVSIEEVETDALDDAVVYCWVTKGKSGYYFFGSPYATREKAEQYPPGRNGDYEYALVRVDLSGIKFSKRV